MNMRSAIRGHVRIFARVLRVIAAHQVTIQDGSAIDAVVLETVLHKRALTDGWHEASMTLRHRRVIRQVTGGI